MPAPTPPVQVSAWWTLTNSTVDVWTVEDPTRGDITAHPIAGDIETDITGYVLPGISITRGRDRQNDEMAPGTAVVRLNNRLRTFDPLNVSSPFAGNIVPRKRFVVRSGGVTLYTGNVADYDYQSAHGELSVAEVSLEDSLATLARATMDAWTPASGTASQQINDALDRPEVGFTAARDITGGASQLGAFPLETGVNVLDFLQLAARSDLGRVFASRDDVVVFRDRLSVVPAGTAGIVYFGDHARTADVLTDPVLGILTDELGSPLTSGPAVETVDRIPFAAITLAYGSDALFTRTVVSSVGGSTEIVDDLEGTGLYGQISTGDTYTNLLLDSDEQASGMADFLAAMLSDPQTRVASITVKLAACLTSAQQGTVLALDIGSLVNVRYTPDNIGDPIDQTCVVEGVRHDINRLIDHDITLRLGDVLQSQVWTVEDPARGALDQTAVAF